MKIRIKAYNGELPSYLTMGKVYEVKSRGVLGFWISVDSLEDIYVLLNDCYFLNGGAWEVVVSEFDEWFKSLNEDGRTTYFLGQEGNISKEAWDFQQAKIDELQAKVDGALGFTEDVHSENWQEVIHCINSILKGNKDEN